MRHGFIRRSQAVILDPSESTDPVRPNTIKIPWPCQFGSMGPDRSIYTAALTMQLSTENLLVLYSMRQLLRSKSPAVRSKFASFDAQEGGLGDVHKRNEVEEGDSEGLQRRETQLHSLSIGQCTTTSSIFTARSKTHPPRQEALAASWREGGSDGHFPLGLRVAEQRNGCIQRPMPSCRSSLATVRRRQSQL